MRMLSWFFGVLLLAWPAYAQVPSVFIEDLTWPEVRDAIVGGKRTAIIYVGSSEQNGPHMVIGKHNFVARALAQRIAERLGDALVYPILPYAVAGNALTRTGHMRFPGTVTLTPEAFFAVVRGVGQSALTAGFKVVAIMGDHGGGQDEMALAAKELDSEARASDARILFIGDLYAKSRVQMRELLAQRGLPTDEDHAGIHDTSALLALETTPGQWVRKDKLSLADAKTGVQGHPQFATPEPRQSALWRTVEMRTMRSQNDWVGTPALRTSGRLLRSAKEEHDAMRMDEVNIHDYARQLLEAHGDKAVVEAAQKACAFEKQGENEQAETWRHIEAALKLMRGPHVS